jgi:tetratricopeptide (TPR) repeat protein
LLVHRERRAKLARRRAEYEERVLELAGRLRLVDLVASAEAGRRDLFKTGWGAIVDLDPAAMAPPREYMEGVADGLARCVGLFPRRPDAHYHRARALMELDRDDEAKRELEKILESEATFAPARALLVRLLEKGGEGDRARAERDNVQSGAAPPWMAAWSRAQEESRARRWEEAAREFEAAGRLYREEPEPYLGFALDLELGKGYAYLRSGRRAKAIDAFNRAVDRSPESLEARVLLARAFSWRAPGTSPERTTTPTRFSRMRIGLAVTIELRCGARPSLRCSTTGSGPTGGRARSGRSPRIACGGCGRSASCGNTARR